MYPLPIPVNSHFPEELFVAPDCVSFLASLFGMEVDEIVLEVQWLVYDNDMMTYITQAQFLVKVTGMS